MAMVVIAMAMLVAVLPTSPASTTPSSPETVEVIVQETAAATRVAEGLVTQLGGTVIRQLPIIGGFSAEVPADHIGLIGIDPSVLAITPNMLLNAMGDETTLPGFEPKDYAGSMYEVSKFTKVEDVWGHDVTGAGIDVAVIDSGVTPVMGLDAGGKVVNGPDLSFDSQYDNVRHLDAYGHGTHMAGIIAGRDTGIVEDYDKAVKTHFVGIAPEARIVNMKVGDAQGVTDVSQVIAAIDWVVQHRNSNGLNIRC
jgi:serine protease AprX